MSMSLFMSVRSWIECNEAARDMLARVHAGRPVCLRPPLHRVPFRAGNVIEIAGPSPSAKSELLIQVAIHCILPKEWNGVHYGGLERLVVYFDLDCRFDILRLSHSLKKQIVCAQGSKGNTVLELHEAQLVCGSTVNVSKFDEELFQACMRRFLYIRCYSSYEFLAALKSARHKLQEGTEAHGDGIHFFMIDSISAFYWMDRAIKPSQFGGSNWTNLSLKNVSEAVVMEIRRLMEVHPMLVLATKATIFGLGTRAGDTKSDLRDRVSTTWLLPEDSCSTISTGGTEKIFFQEFMPLAWQSFITHKILLTMSDANSGSYPLYTSHWMQPPLMISDKFVVREDGIIMLHDHLAGG